MENNETYSECLRPLRVIFMDSWRQKKAGVDQGGQSREFANVADIKGNNDQNSLSYAIKKPTKSGVPDIKIPKRKAEESPAQDSASKKQKY